MVTAGILPFRENFHGRAGNRTRDLMISSQKLWPLDYEAGHDTKVKPEAATAVIELLMMGGKTPETCWTVNKRQDNKLKNCCIRLVIYLNWIFVLVNKITLHGTVVAERNNLYYKKRNLHKTIALRRVRSTIIAVEKQ
jgi:hypothetical protein